MATLQVGHYPINSKTAEHAFAIMSHNGNEYRFKCFGSVWDSGRYYPAEYYEPRSMWYTRSGSITGYKELPCHPQIAIHLAQWGGSVDWWKYDYDKEHGDNSGIVYALNGVCHQMCNTITCATKTDNPINSLINWPQSLNASKLIYGNRGTWGHERAVKDYVAALLRFYGDAIDGDADAQGDLDASGLDAELAAIEEQQRATMRNALANGPDLDERRMLVGNAVPGLDSIEPAMAADAEAMALKHELDNLLIRGEVSREEYAARMNEGVRALVDRYAEVMGQEAFTGAFGDAAENIDCNIIDVEFMLDDYTAVKEQLGL